jgi:hypothetical protein
MRKAGVRVLHRVLQACFVGRCFYRHKEEHEMSSYCDAVGVCSKCCGVDSVFILIEYYCRLSCDALYFGI